MATSKLRSFLINDTDQCVEEALEGLCLLNPEIRKIKDYKIVVRRPEKIETGKVALLSGGGAGHEPAHAGYVGVGMLSGAVSGHIFASPSSDEVLQAILHLMTDNKAAGVLLIVKNYTGDRLNFGIAAQRAKSMGIPISMVVVSDDVALESAACRIDRRGLAGTVFIHKLAGAMAEDGYSLQDISSTIEGVLTSQVLATVNIALSSCQIPGTAKSSFDLEEGMAELGLGIHGEMGVRRIRVTSARDVICEIMKMMIGGADSHSKDYKLRFRPGDSVALMLNNLGGCTSLEMHILVQQAVTSLESKYHVKVVRKYVGHYMTSTTMAGASVTIFHLKEERFLGFLDAPTSAPGWHQNYQSECHSLPTQIDSIDLEYSQCLPTAGQPIDESIAHRMVSIVTAICDTLCSEEARLNDLDRESGDGDCGSSHRRGAQAILKLKEQRNSFDIFHPSRFLSQISHSLESSMGGTSGAVWSIFFAGAASFLSDNGEMDFLPAFTTAVSQVSRLGGAHLGDRSLLDALIPALNSWDRHKDENSSAIAKHMAEAAESGSANTGTMTPRVGRASYVDATRVTASGSPDPGAMAVALALRAVSHCLESSISGAESS